MTAVAISAAMPSAEAQTSLPRIEVGALFAHVRLAEPGALGEYYRQYEGEAIPVWRTSETGFGGRLAVPVRRWFAVETDFSLVLRAFKATPESILFGETEVSEKVFFFAGPRVSRRFKQVELFARAMSGLVQVGLVPRITHVDRRTLPGRTFVNVEMGEPQASVSPGIKIGAGASWPIAGRLRARADAGDVLVFYRLQSDPVRVAFHRHNLAVDAGISVDVGMRHGAGEASGSRSWAAAFRAWDLGVSLGIARNSPVGTHLGATPNRDHLIIGLQARKTIVERGRWSATYAPEVVPLLLLSNNPSHGVQALGAEMLIPSAADAYHVKIISDEGPSRIPGFAITPFSAETDLRWTPRWRTFANGGLGCVWFVRGTPIREARAFNYTFEFGGGIIRDIGRGRSIRVGYKFHHLSSDYTSLINPGVDGHVMVFGYGWSGTH